MSRSPAVSVKLPSGIAVRVSALGLGVGEAAELVGIGEAELRRRIRSGELPTIQVGRRRLIPVSRLIQWLHEAAG
jgi:excisionase family DNA binding protein